MRILRLKDVMAKTGLSRSCIYKYITEGKFPESIKLGQRSVGWVESEIDEWLESKAKQRFSD
ncbi:helix-turn-helix transcriptional regulator [Methylophaga thiooxydans]|uniref:helix-turn-helix transcriptional regulator n=1 Tax=Methylophaga thiooxydans TaxID=392484 RepID=UPI002353355E|nr:AlpA family transcriptional regulator [Methylophaga thiooxydans]